MTDLQRILQINDLREGLRATAFFSVALTLVGSMMLWGFGVAMLIGGAWCACVWLFGLWILGGLLGENRQ